MNIDIFLTMRIIIFFAFIIHKRHLTQRQAARKFKMGDL